MIPNKKQNKDEKKVIKRRNVSAKKTTEKSSFLKFRPIKRKNKVLKEEKTKDSITKKVLSGIASVFLTIFLIGCITGTIVVGAFAIYIKNYIDPVIEDFDLISTDQKLSSKIYYMDYSDRDNRIGEAVELGDQRLYGSENRIWVSLTDMPVYLYEAFISIEDERFWTHDGVDWKRTIGATFFFFTGGDNYGGSTITQQLIKNITGDKDFRIQRKLQEVMRALYLDKTKDKTEILELYLNTIYLSQGCYGVQAAANTYFGKDVSELSLVECAAIARITQAPTYWDPIQNPENNKYGREVVLDKMYELGKITYSEYTEAYNTELVLNTNSDIEDEIDGDKPSDGETYNSWYTDAVIKHVVKRLVQERNVPENIAYNMVYSGGLSIYTVMDPDVQKAMEDVYRDSDVFQNLKGVIQPESSMVIIHPTTGDVLGIAGGRGEKTGNLLLNYATDTTRSPGSSIKPLAVYAPALQAGIINNATVYDDVPVNMDTGMYQYDEKKGLITYHYPETNQTVVQTRGWPNNLPIRYDGLVNISYAIQVSKNTTAIRVLQDLTCDVAFDFVKNKLHMDSFIEKQQLPNGQWITDKGLVALAMGEMNFGVTNLEITAAYSIFVNNGVYNEPRLITQVLDSEGNVVLGDNCESSIVLSEQNASLMTKMLTNVVERGVSQTIQLRHRVNVAGKTGTTNADHDRWFIGYTPYAIGGVWYGYAEPDSLASVVGNPSADIWDEVMKLVHEKYFIEAETNLQEVKSFGTARGVVEQIICKDSGKLMTDACRADPRGDRSELSYFTHATVPTEECDKHVLVKYDSKTKAVACNGCPEEDVVEVGLLNITTRNFPIVVYVTDAQYTFRELPEGVVPSDKLSRPFYYNMLDGLYPGVSYVNSVNNEQFNRACFAHYIKPEETQMQTTAPVLPADIPRRHDD